MATAAEECDAAVSAVSTSPETAGDVIRKIEAKYDLLQYEVDGWSVWPVLRFPVAFTLLNFPFHKSKEPYRLWELLRIAARDLPALIFARRARYFVVTYSSAFLEQEGEHFKDVFFDDLLRQLGDFYKIEKLNNKSFSSRSRAALIKSDATTIGFDLLISMFLHRFNVSDQLPAIADKMSANLRREPGLEGFTTERILGELKDFYWRKRLYSWLLKKIRPEYLFSSDGYSDHAVIAAAQERGIKVCEFQHGSFEEELLPAYAWSSYAAKYQAQMLLPDKLFLYGDYWKQQLEAARVWEGRLHSVGSLRIDQYRKSRSHDHSALADTRKILLTTQGIDTEALIAFIKEFLKIGAGKAAIELAIKLHPAFESNKQIYERSFAEHQQVRVISGSESPSTFELLSAADLHLSISSTCHYDALGLGVPSVILPLASSGYVMPLYKRGDALLAVTPRALLDIVVNLRECSVPEATSRFYFKPDALRNMKRALEA